MTKKPRILLAALLALLLSLSALVPPAAALSITVPEAQTQAVEDSSLRYGITTAPGVNLRAEASTKAKSLGKIPNTGTAVFVLEDVSGPKDEAWYAVRFGGQDAFIRADLLTLISKDAYDALLAAETEKAAARASSGSSSGKSTSGSKAATSSETRKERLVYVVSKGECYHSSSRCSNMKSPYQVTLDEAKGMGRRPCSKCY